MFNNCLSMLLSIPLSITFSEKRIYFSLKRFERTDRVSDLLLVYAKASIVHPVEKLNVSDFSLWLFMFSCIWTVASNSCQCCSVMVLSADYFAIGEMYISCCFLKR